MTSALAKSQDANYVSQFLTELELLMPGFKIIEASVWVVTLIDAGTELSPQQAAKMFEAEYGGT